MKTTIWTLAIAIMSIFPTAQLDARGDHKHHNRHKNQHTVRIEIGEGEGNYRIKDIERRGFNHKAHRYYNRDLRRRLRTLEEVVNRLQDEVDDLRRENRSLRSRDANFACYIKTPFDGTFLGKGSTLIEATAQALNRCEKKATSWCNERKVKCDRA